MSSSTIDARRPERAARFRRRVDLAPPWAEDALCAEIDAGDAWFPDKRADEAPAKAVCARCAVRPECFAFAIDTRQEYGVWGGVGEGERRALIRAERRRSVA